MRSKTVLAIATSGAPSSNPHTPHSQPKNSRLMNRTAALTRAKRLCSQVMNTNPTAPASSSDAPPTVSACSNDPDWRKAAAPLPSDQRRAEIGNEVKHPGGDPPDAGVLHAERE